MRLSGAWARLASVVALVGLVFAGTARAQSGTAALYGKVTDQSDAALPGVTVTITDPAAGITRSTVSDAEGGYQFLALPPGTYAVKAELTGFRTATREKVELPVDVRTKMDLPMAIGQMSETVEVTSMVSPINTTDASLGNTISGTQIRALPLEANNVVGLLSLQPGAVYLPHTANTDPRSGSVSGSRADQSNVTLDGVDVNDPQFGTAYTSALRITTDALQEFRVATSNYGADTGRSSAAQVSMVTKSGTNMFHGSGTYTERDTKFSSKEYFLGLSGQDKAKLDKKIGGGAVGGPIKKDKLFFFGNYERLQESSESPVNRAVPSDTMRDGVLIYGCSVASQCPGSTVQGFTSSHAVPAGFYGLGPGAAGRHRPAAPRAEQARLRHLQQVPALERPRSRRLQHRRLPLRVADRERVQHLHHARGLPRDAVAEPVRAPELPARRDVGSAAVPRTTRPGTPTRSAAAASPSATTGCSARTRSTRSATATRTSSRTRSACRRRRP